MRAHNFAPYGRRRPAETACSTAVPCILLIRMRSQVQVLAGPPPNPAGHSVAGNRPGMPAASLGRAGAAPRPRPAPRAGGHPDGPPPRSPLSVVAHQPRTAATQPVRPARAAACSPAHSVAASHGRSVRRLAAWSRSRQARPPPTHNPGPGSATDTPTDHHATSGGVAPQGSSAVDPAARRCGRHSDLDSLLWCRVARPPRPGPSATA
jgi:hypothetical protein